VQLDMYYFTGRPKMNSCYIRYDHDHYTTSTTHAPITDLLSCARTVTTIVSPKANPNRYVTWEKQSFHQRINNKTHVTRLPHSTTFCCDYTVVWSFQWEIFYKSSNLSDDGAWQYNGQRLGTGKAYNCQTKCLWTMHFMWLLSQVSLQCENKFIASFPLGLGNGLG
jgi:hypothetical protein